MASHDHESTTGSELLNPATDGATSSSRALATPSAPAMPTMLPGMGAQGPEIIHGGINQTWLFNCLRRRWLLALCMGLLMGGVVGLGLLLVFPESSLTLAYVEVKPKADSSALSDKADRMSPTEIEGYKMSHLTMVKQQSVLEAALRQRENIRQLPSVDKEDDPVLWMIEELQVSFPSEGNYMEIRYEGDEDPVEMQQVVQAIVDEYIKVADTDEKQRKQEMIDKLKSQQEEITRDLKEKHVELANERKFAENAHSPGAEMETKQLMTELIRQETLELDTRRELMEIEVAARVALQESTSEAMINQLVQADLEQDMWLQQYEMQLFENDMRLQSLMSSHRNKNAAPIQQAQAARESLVSMIAQTRAQKERELKQKYKSMPNDMLKAVVAEKNIRQAAAMQRLREHQAKIVAIKERLAQLAETDPDIEWAMREIEADQEALNDLKQRMSNLEVQEVAGEKVRIAQQAITTEDINTLERFAIAGVGGLAAMLATCYAVALVEFRRRRLNGPRDIDEGLGIRVLGVLPSTTAAKSLSGGSLVSAQVSESIDNVRATLMHDASRNRRQVVLVASPATMEGSTTAAANLAVSLARAGRRTLLLDGDLRAPSLHKLFGLPLDAGFCEVLRSEIDVTDAVQASSTEGLYVLTAGACDMDAIHALATDLPQPIFDKLRAEFEFIVIDGAPVLGLADSLSLGQFVDGAVLTVLRDHSELRQVHRSIELMKDLGIDVIGSIINGVPLKADRRIAQLHRATAARAKQLPPAQPAQAAETVAQPSSETATIDPEIDLDLDDLDLDSE